MYPPTDLNEMLSGRLMTGGILIVLAAILPHFFDWQKSRSLRKGLL